MRCAGAILMVGAVVLVAPRSSDAQPVPVASIRERVRVSGEVGVAVFFPSRYAESLRLFGYEGIAPGTAIVARTTVRWRELLVVGARLGWLHSGTTARTPRGAIHYNLVDLGVVFGVGTRQRQRGDSVRAELVAEAGATLGDASLANVGQLVASVRVGGSGLLGWFLAGSHIYLGARCTAAYLPWNGAGGSFADPALANVTSAIELGGVL